MSIQSTEGAGVPDWDLSDRLRKSLRHGDVARDEMAAELGVTPKTVSDYANGHVVPRRPVLVVWALRCGVDLKWLETGEVAARPEPDGTVAPTSLIGRKTGREQVIQTSGCRNGLAGDRPLRRVA